ncbi:MAG: hypothetical protein DWQ10_09265 [Calditrichaeota bacterium]|nr:MAG: hypothetical protein DWQ10_09265 [Calditrichota bacterium]
MKQKKIAFFCGALIVTICSIAPPAQAQVRTNGAKFGFFDLSRPAVGIAREFGGLSPRLRFNFDGDLVFQSDHWLFADFSLKYFPRTHAEAAPYFGGGAGVNIGDIGGVAAHFVAGLNFRLEHIRMFAEIKAHLDKPDAVSLWVGLRY